MAKKVIPLEAQGVRYKNKRYTEDGLLKWSRSRNNNWIIVVDSWNSDGTPNLRKIWHRGKPTSSRTGNCPENVINNPKARSNGFDKNPQNIYKGNVGQRLVKEREAKKKQDVLWKESQRECLDKMLHMERGTLYSYMVQWKLLTIGEVAKLHGYVVTEEKLKTLDQSEPTMVQLVCIQMVLSALSTPKFAYQILELLEGRPVSVLNLEEKGSKKQKSETQDAQTMSELDSALAKLQQDILGSDETPSEPVKVSTGVNVSEELETSENDLEEPTNNEDFLNSIINGE